MPQSGQLLQATLNQFVHLYCANLKINYADSTVNMSVKTSTGVECKAFKSRHRSRIFWLQGGASREARLLSNFLTSSGMPSARRRRWPTGYSTTMFSVAESSVKKTWTALAIERLSGSRYSLE